MWQGFIVNTILIAVKKMDQWGERSLLMLKMLLIIITKTTPPDSDSLGHDEAQIK